MKKEIILAAKIILLEKLDAEILTVGDARTALVRQRVRGPQRDALLQKSLELRARRDALSKEVEKGL